MDVLEMLGVDAIQAGKASERADKEQAIVRKGVVLYVDDQKLNRKVLAVNVSDSGPPLSVVVLLPTEIQIRGKLSLSPPSCC